MRSTNPKSEIRIPKEIRISKSKTCQRGLASRLQAAEKTPQGTLPGCHNSWGSRISDRLKPGLRTILWRGGFLPHWQSNGFLPGARHSANFKSAIFNFQFSIPLLLLLLLLPVGAFAKLNVVATTPDLGAIAQAVGGDEVVVSVLTKPTEDPHFVDAKPSFSLKLSRADALLEGGAELEIGWLPSLLEQARNPRLAAGAPGRIVGNQGVKMLEVPTELDRSQGDVHAAGNPHYLMDPENALIVAENTARAFAQLDAAHAAQFHANLARFKEQVGAKLAEWQKRLAPFQGEHVVSYHNSWVYFGRRFGLQMDLFLEPKPGIPPTPAHLAKVEEHIREQKIKVIFVEPYVNQRTAERVAKDTGARVVQAAQFPGAIKGTEGGYIALMDYLVKALAAELEKGR